MRRRRQQERSGNGRRTISVDGVSYEVRRKERIRGRTYLLLKLLAPTPRERWLAFDPGAAGQPCTVLIVPNDHSTAQRVKVLKEIPKGHSIRILDFDRRDDRTLIVLPWERGVDLDEYLRRVKDGQIIAPTPLESIRLFRELALGLSAMHRHAGLIHADVKPPNLILTRKASHIRLIDFGSAWPIRMTGVRLEGDGISGVYAAPELQTIGTGDERVDQFSATLVLYLLLTGEIPYGGIGGKAGWPQWMSEGNVLVPPSDIAKSDRFVPTKLWKQIDDLVACGLSLDPSQRFETPSAWVNAIESVYLELKLREHNTDRRLGSWNAFWSRLARLLGVPANQSSANR